ncbi:MAG: HlyD family efflux transporter periplasmic adaptor subunit, partial [Chloracidobacterium sp.]|nr:HlyD family efflux transporter periplasmic adaptor subunit [Chloracidobacterium sp.]
PGDAVREDTVLIEMSNPELERDALRAQTQLVAAEAELANQSVQFRSQYLEERRRPPMRAPITPERRLSLKPTWSCYMKAWVPIAHPGFQKARLKNWLNARRSRRSGLEISADSIKAQIAIYEARVRQSRALYDLRRKQLDALKVRAGLGGVVHDVAAQVGQQVAIGANLALVADPSKLKAVIRIAETQTKDIAIGQRVEIDTRNGVIEGRVIRIAPAPTQGTLPIDVALDGELPRGARPDMNVDGTIEIERLNDVLYVQRPAIGQERSVITLFKYVAGGREAVRVQVKLGRFSVTDVEILEGLNAF